MDPSSPIFAHQFEAVLALSDKFQTVYVLTAQYKGDKVPGNVKVICSDWRQGHKISSFFRLLTRSLPVVFGANYESVFFHMTDLQCAFLSPLIRMRKKRQYLWYAHTRHSKYLKFASYFVDAIVTSTHGSCPIKDDRVKIIGQAINQNNFRPIEFKDLKLNKLIHIGRFDKSKNLELLIKEASILRATHRDLCFKVVGSPANRESIAWSELLRKQNISNIQEGWLSFSGSVPRSKFSELTSQNGCFFHAYLGSLDKTLIESTMLRVPVVTINPEYITIFGSWSGNDTPDLVTEYNAMIKLSRNSLQSELDRRLKIAVSAHSLENWVLQLSEILG
jgi:glycosyltransferase involved in cell wall biosynthesis